MSSMPDWEDMHADAYRTHYVVTQVPRARGAADTLAKIIMWVAGVAIGVPLVMGLGLALAMMFIGLQM